MSPPHKDEHQTADRKSSSALFSAFRTLTGRRATNAASPSPTTPVILTPAALMPIDIAPLQLESKTETQNGEIGVFDHGVDNIAQQHGKALTQDSSKANDLIGGPPELAQLLEQLNSSNATSDRLAAIGKVCYILSKYKVSNVLLLWSAASDLLEMSSDPDAMRAGYTLLQSCVRVPELSSLERSVFFQAISRNHATDDSDLRFQALVDLTNGGRNVDSFEASVAQYVGSSLIDCFVRGRGARRKQRKSKSGSTTKPDADHELDRMFKFVIDVVKFNSKIFREQDISLLLDQIVRICRQTSRVADVEKSITLFEMLVTYTQIPGTSLKSCLELFCDVYRQLKNVQDLTWRALGNLLQSHAGPTAVSALLDILQDSKISQGPKKNISRGAMRVIQRLLIADGEDGLPRIPLSDVLGALKASLAAEHRRLEFDILELVGIILTDQNLSTQLLDEDDWTDLVDVVALCARGHSPQSSNISDTTSETRSTSDRTVSESGGTNDALLDVFEHLRKIHGIADFGQRDSVFDLLLRLASVLDHTTAEFLVQQHATERLLHPSNTLWQVASSDLLEKIFKDPTRPRHLRVHVLELLIENFNTIDGVYADATVLAYARLVLENIPDEKDAAVLDILVNFAVSLVDYPDMGLFTYILNNFKGVLDEQTVSSPNISSHASPSPPFPTQSTASLGSTSNTVVRGAVRMFMQNLNRSGEKSEALYELLVQVAGKAQYQTDARITALKLLFRLRCDTRYAVVVNPSSEGQAMASVLFRTAETASATTEDTTSTVDETRTSAYRASSASSPHSSLSRQISRTANVANRATKPSPPLWMYPGPRGLPEEPPSTASHLVFSFIDSEDECSQGNRRMLRIALWLELVISILQRDDDWEVYSYVLVHLGSQLTNQSLFRSCVPHIKMLRNVLCEQIRASSFQEPPSHTLLKKADVAICLFYILTVLISYNQHFEKSEEDELVRTFLLGIGSWDRTSKWCIHAITICCHELPLSTSKSLDNIIQKMSQIITQQQIAVHILEFLTALSRMPDLYINFREEEFKMVFGVSFRYLQYIRYQQERTSTPNLLRNSNSAYGTLRHSGPSREFPIPEQESKSKGRPAADDLPQYVHALAYHVITFWFMALKLQDRRNQMAWISKNLIHTDSNGKEVMEEQSQVTIDMIQRVAFSDRDETAPDPKFAVIADGEVSKKTWIVGHSLLTIETAARSGASQVTTRRASGTRYLTLRPNVTRPPRHQVPIYTGLAAEAFYTSSYVGILPDDIMQTMYSPFSFPTADIIRAEPVALPDDDMTRRAIDTFDRNSTVDCHKIGVVYVGHGQTKENEILSNVVGSPDYTSFIADLGTLTRLKGATFNTGGLDRENDSDGEFAYCWRDRCTEIVFHVATLLPTDPSNPETILRKKAHIGNDYVTIVFNNSGQPYVFDTIRSQFNYVVIVITPEARASFVDARLASDPAGKSSFYKVQVLSQPGFPDVSPAAETKVISGKHLASCVRLIALNANFFSLVWAVKDGGESISHWRNRLREIKKLRERHKVDDPQRTLTPPPQSNSTNHGQSLFSGSHPRDSAMSFKRGSIAGLPGESYRSSFLSGGQDMERQGSDSTR